MEAEMTLPAKGERVRFRRKGDVLWESGTVELEWWCCGERCVDVRTDDGGSVSVFSEMGDLLEAATVGGVPAPGRRVARAGDDGYVPRRS